MMSLFIAITIALAQLPKAAAPVSPAPTPTVPDPDILALLPGDWRIVDSKTGEVKQNCDRAQRLTVSADQKAVLLTEPWANFTARYSVIHREGARILTMIDAEKRLTAEGDPVLWWIYLEDADHFRFRRYDWVRGDVTIDQWQRCPAK